MAGTGIILHQYDIGCLHGLCCAATTHRYADIGLRERRRIVDAVTDHGDDPPCAMQLRYGRCLVLWLHAAARFIHAGLGADRRRDFCGITREHQRAYAHIAQGGDGCNRFGP